MPNFDAAKGDCELVSCAVCEKAITGGHWFARIKHGEWMVALCCPLCAEVFEGNPHAYIRRVETLEFMRGQRAASEGARGLPS